MNMLWLAKRKQAAIFVSALFAFVLSACGNSAYGNTSSILMKNITVAESRNAVNESASNAKFSDISIQVGGAHFTATLYDSDAAQALIGQLPLHLHMSELNGNEKYYYLPTALPTAGEWVGDIRAGDLMLYGADCLVLFYEGFGTSYSYTRLGYIADAAGLAEALGSGDVEVIFTLNR